MIKNYLTNLLMKLKLSNKDCQVYHDPTIVSYLLHIDHIY